MVYNIAICSLEVSYELPFFLSFPEIIVKGMDRTTPYHAGKKSDSSTMKNTKANCAICKGTPVDGQMQLRDVCDTHFKDRMYYLLNKVVCPVCNRKVFKEELVCKEMEKDCCKQYRDTLGKSFDEYMTNQLLKSLLKIAVLQYSKSLSNTQKY